jgi:hypothetical protein
MRAFPQNPLTDGMAWSGFDSAAANIAGGADAVFGAIGVSRAVVDRPGMQARRNSVHAICPSLPYANASGASRLSIDRATGLARACGKDQFATPFIAHRDGLNVRTNRL